MINKFKIGDLVTLSTAGRKIKQNSHAFGGWGIIRDIKESYSSYPIVAAWWGCENESDGISISFKPYELKFYKNK